MARALLAATAVAGLLALAGVPPAAAQGGAGLYAPFPEHVRAHRARAFFGPLLPTTVSLAALRRGVVLPAGVPLERGARVGGSPASDRAGAGADPDGGAGWLAGIAVAAAAAAGLAAVALHRRPPVPR